jgi:hypothetical protein
MNVQIPALGNWPHIPSNITTRYLAIPLTLSLTVTGLFKPNRTVSGQSHIPSLGVLDGNWPSQPPTGESQGGQHPNGSTHLARSPRPCFFSLRPNCRARRKVRPRLAQPPRWQPGRARDRCARRGSDGPRRSHDRCGAGEALGRVRFRMSLSGQADVGAPSAAAIAGGSVVLNSEAAVVVLWTMRMAERLLGAADAEALARQCHFPDAQTRILLEARSALLDGVDFRKTGAQVPASSAAEPPSCSDEPLSEMPCGASSCSADAAHQLTGVSTGFIRRLARHGRLEGKRGPNGWELDRASVVEYAQSRKRR